MMLMLVNGSVGWPFSIFKLLLPLWVFVLAHYLSFSQKESVTFLSFCECCWSSFPFCQRVRVRRREEKEKLSILLIRVTKCVFLLIECNTLTELADCCWSLNTRQVGQLFGTFLVVMYKQTCAGVVGWWCCWWRVYVICCCPLFIFVLLFLAIHFFTAYLHLLNGSDVVPAAAVAATLTTGVS